MPHYFILTTFVAALLFADASARDNTRTLEASAICVDHNVEGLYSGTIQDHGHADIYLICTGKETIAATWVMNGAGSTSISLSHFAIDGDRLTLASFTLTPGDAIGIPANATPSIRLEVNMSALREGTLKGVYKTASRPQPKRVLANRARSFPSPLEQGKVASGSPGTFVYDGGLGHSGLHSPIFLDLDVIEGFTRISLGDAANNYYTLMVGVSQFPRDDVYYGGSGASGADGVILPMIQIRGRFVSADTFEFYYFNTLYGFAGPYRARRFQNPMLVN